MYVWGYAMLMIAYHRELDNIVESTGDSANSYSGLKTIFGKPDEYPQFDEFLWISHGEGLEPPARRHHVTRIDGSSEI